MIFGIDTVVNEWLSDVFEFFVRALAPAFVRLLGESAKKRERERKTQLPYPLPHDDGPNSLNYFYVKLQSKCTPEFMKQAQLCGCQFRDTQKEI